MRTGSQPGYAAPQDGRLPPPRKARRRPTDRPAARRDATLAAVEAAPVEDAALVLAELMGGLRHGYGDVPECPEPTDAAPGSEAKIQVLRDRASRGVSLWHPRDAAGVPREGELATHDLLAAAVQRRLAARERGALDDLAERAAGRPVSTPRVVALPLAREPGPSLLQEGVRAAADALREAAP